MNEMKAADFGERNEIVLGSINQHFESVSSSLRLKKYIIHGNFLLSDILSLCCAERKKERRSSGENGEREGSEREREMEKREKNDKVIINMPSFRGYKKLL
jgi:hypothetical protein